MTRFIRGPLDGSLRVRVTSALLVVRSHFRFGKGGSSLELRDKPETQNDKTMTLVRLVRPTETLVGTNKCSPLHEVQGMLGIFD